MVVVMEMVFAAHVCWALEALERALHWRQLWEWRIGAQQQRLMSDSVADFTSVFNNSKKVVDLSRAGISTKFGIPTFRGEGGLWRNFDATVQEIYALDAQGAQNADNKLAKEGELGDVEGEGEEEGHGDRSGKVEVVARASE